MEILEVAKYIGGIIAVILVGLIKIPKLELNIWNWLGRLVGRSLTKELTLKLDQMEQN
ncbi:MAG: hypothetical protein J6Y28_04260 [Acholeplasmatales bacterium]|nr:hypothetical protein [Methanobrevibacter sp.]MBP5445367.1 hypothetical protein [Acholeplasmatales bacterium]